MRLVVLTLMKKPTKTGIAIVFFALAEAFAFVKIIDALFFLGRVGFVGYFYAIWGLSLALSGLLSWFYFTKWRAQLKTKILVASIFFVVSFFLFAFIGLSLMQWSAVANPPY